MCGGGGGENSNRSVVRAAGLRNFLWWSPLTKNFSVITPHPSRVTALGGDHSQVILKVLLFGFCYKLDGIVF